MWTYVGSTLRSGSKGLLYLVGTAGGIRRSTTGSKGKWGLVNERDDGARDRREGEREERGRVREEESETASGTGD